MEGHEVYFLTVNIISGVDNQADLAARCEFPILQDTPEANAWTAHQGGKDDFFIYSNGGQLQVHLPAQGDIDTNLSTLDGYRNLKAAIMQAVADTR